MQMLQNVKVPKLERKNKVKIKNRPEKPKIQYDKKQKKYGKKDNPVGEKHYWSDNYVPKEYGKYKQSNKKYKPLQQKNRQPKAIDFFMVQEKSLFPIP